MGGHSHDYGDATYIPEKNALKLIRCTIGQNTLPIDAVVLGEDSFSGLTITNADDKYISAASTPQSIAESAYLSISSEGAHNHGRDSVILRYQGATVHTGTATQRYKASTILAGDHKPTIPLTVTENLKRLHLSL